jgi:hypothetical protein
VAAFCLLGLLLTLGAAALASLRPWESDSVAPGLSVTPGLGAGVGEGPALGPANPGGVAAARVAPSSSPGAVAAAVTAPPRNAPQPELAVSTARAVGDSTAIPVSAPPAEAPAAPAPAPNAAPPVPVAAPAPAAAPTPPLLGGGSGGPVPSGGPEFEPEPACEGDEYTVTIGYGSDAVGEEFPVQILVARLEDDGSVSELHLEGDLGDAEALIEQLSQEGNCVEVVFEPVPEAGGVPQPAEASGDSTELDPALE